MQSILKKVGIVLLVVFVLLTVLVIAAIIWLVSLFDGAGDEVRQGVDQAEQQFRDDAERSQERLREGADDAGQQFQETREGLQEPVQGLGQ